MNHLTSLITAITILFNVIVPSAVSAGVWRENFNDGNFVGWKIEKLGEETQVEVKNGEASIKGLVFGHILADAPEWTNYTMQCMVKGIEGFHPGWQFNIYVRVQPAFNGNYTLGVKPEEGLMFFSIHPGAGMKSITVVKRKAFQMHVWHQVKIVAEGNQIQFYVDKTLIEAIKDDRHPSGGIAFDAINGHIHLDDIVVEGPDIPNGTPETTFSVERFGKLSTTWSRIKAIF